MAIAGINSLILGHVLARATWFGALALAAMLLGLGGCASRLPPLVLTYSSAELETLLNERFPLQKRESVLYDLTLTQPKVALDSVTKRVRITAQVDLKFPLATRGVTGSVSFSGRPRYEAAGRAVYLDDGRVDILDLAGLPSSLQGPLREALSGIARDHLATRPLTVIREERLNKGPISLTPQVLEVRPEGLRVEFDLGRRS
jgi:hypothetical protein